LQLETNDFPAYSATLRDSATGQILWKAAKLRTTSEGENRIVSFNFPAKRLKQQSYVVELTGVPNRGAAELVAAYAFRVVLV